MAVSRPLSTCFQATLLAACVNSAMLGQEPTASQSDTASSQQETIAADLYQFPPKTPAELMEAARITQRLDRFSDSRAFLRQLLDLQLGENELQSLREQLGPSPFLDLRSDIRLRPESEQLLRSVNAAIQAKTWTLQELQEFAQRLGTPGSTGIKAATELVESGDAAIPVLLATDIATPSGRVANEVLQKHARSLRFGLLNQLAVSDPAMRVRLLRLLGTTADSELAIRLLRWQFDPTSDPDVATAARAAIAELCDNRLDDISAAEASEALVQLAETELKVAGARFSTLDEPESLREITGVDSRIEALKRALALCADATVIDPQNERTKIITLVAQCAIVDPSVAANSTAVSGKSADDIFAGLAAALDLHPAAAIELLRETQSVPPQQVDMVEAGRVLRKALVNADARVRFLAANAVRTQIPVEVSRVSVSQSMTSARDGAVKPEMVIVSPDNVQLRTLQAVFQDAGYAPQIAETGPGGFEIAAVQMNCELFVLQAESPLWPIETTMTNLRADVRTRNTPIVVIGNERFRKRVESLSGIYDGVWFIAEPAGTETLISKLVQESLPSPLLTSDDRIAMKKLSQQ